MLEEDQFFWKFYAVKTPSGFMCKFCSKVYNNGSFLSLVSHLVDDADHSCLLFPKDAREPLRQALILHTRKRNYSTSSTDQCPPSGGKRTLLSTIGIHLPTTEIVGKQFDEYIKNIWSCLTDDGDNHVVRIGIHGMGGVGKTQVAKYINNKLLQCPSNKFRHVFWVNMSSIRSLLETQLPSRRVRVRDVQSCISKAVGVDVSDGDDESKRASQLLKGLAEKKKSVLILDDVWDCFSLEEVGIPIGVDQFTLVITTRSLEVCRQFGCQRKIKIRCLPPDESYQLFKKKLGNETILSREAEEVSRLVANKCVGLPLAITIMARNLVGVTDIRQWRNALRGGGYTRKKAETEIFQKLKTSYDYLKDATLQHCFLYFSSLIPKVRAIDGFTEYWTDQKRLAEYLVDEGIIKGTNSRREALDEVHTMLYFLNDVGLLEITSYNFIVMNALIQSMALQILEENHENHQMMIKNDMFLKDLPDEFENWSEDLVRVSLQHNEFENIRSNYSPSCPKLSILLLDQNRKLGYIGDSFFDGMPGLKVLELSYTDIESLPRSVCGLVNLTTLLLSRCFKLRSIPSVAKLRALKKLDLNGTPVEQVPEGIEMLSKLTYLDLGCTRVEDLKLAAILTKLSQLQFLGLPQKIAFKGEEIACLRKLETLSCNFCDVAELNKYLIHLKGRKATIQMDVKAGPGPIYDAEFEDSLFNEEDAFEFEFNPDHFNDKDLSGLVLKNCNLNEADMLTMIYFQQIAIVKCNDERSLCNFPPIKGATELKYLSVRDCDGLEFLCSSSSLTGGEGVLENVEYLELFNLKNLNVLFNFKQAENDVCKFSNLTRFCIQDCPSIKRLFSIHLLPNLKNLQRFAVFGCLSMEEIFADDEEIKMDDEKKEIFRLPHLRTLSLKDLPELTRVCGGRTKTCSIPKSCIIQVLNCPKLKYDGISLY